jgi:hypothetical protein
MKAERWETMLPTKVASPQQEKKVAPHFVAQFDFQKCLATSPLTSVVPSIFMP